MGRLTVCGGSDGLPARNQKRRPGDFDIRPAGTCGKVSESSMSCFSSLLEATRPENGFDQSGKAPRGHLLIIELDVDFERITEIGNRFVQPFETSLRHRKARQQVRPFWCFNSAFMRQGGPEIPPRFLKCCSFKCTVTCQRQPTDQFLLVGKRSCLDEMVSDLPGALVDGTGIDQLDRPGDCGVQLLFAHSRDAGK